MKNSLLENFIFCAVKDFSCQLLRYHRKCVNLSSSHQRCSTKKAALKYFAIFTGKHQCWSLFLESLFLWILRDFKGARYYSNVVINLFNTVCNFQSMKIPVQLSSLFSKFFCYVTWFVTSPD